MKVYLKFDRPITRNRAPDGRAFGVCGFCFSSPRSPASGLRGGLPDRY